MPGTTESPAAPPQSTSDPFDLGDTELYPSLESPSPAAPPAEAAPAVARETDAAAPQRPAPAKDPATGRFVSPQETPAAPGTAADPAKPAHPAYLVDTARDLGLTDEELAEVPTAKLHAIVHRFQQTLGRTREQAALQRTLERPTPEHAGAGPTPTAPTPAPADELVIDLGIPEEDYDPQLLGGIKKGLANALAPYVQRIKQLEGALGQLGQREQQREAATNAERIDQAFGALGDKDFLGDGPGRALQSHSPQFSRRMAVLNEAVRLSGERQPSVQKVLDHIGKAHAALFGGRTPAPAPAAPAAPVKPGKPAGISAEQWAQAGLQAPTARRDSQLPHGEERATKNLKEKLREAGEAEPDSETLDGFL